MPLSFFAVKTSPIIEYCIKEEFGMILALKIFATSVGVYAAVRASGIAMAWLKEFFDRMKPGRYDR